MSVQWERESLGPSARKNGAAVRAFFAIGLGGQLRESTAALARDLAARVGGEGVRWTAPDSYHLTLRFLGNVPSADVALLAERAQDALAPCAPFVLTLGPALAFPSARQPRVIALAAQPEGPLADLAARLEKVAVELGLAPEEHAFRAHLTIGRVRARRAPKLDAPAPAGALEVREVVLFRTDLAREGAQYTPLATLPLGASAAPLSPGSN
ncbi:MAG: RNA 2',3'-cyclic phosphodiesterase [Deltaproteobacteria bacterium]|nr:RNA 2',3'-cyclic phosphodiesterase [Deltaproteobacteria bacterium]